VSPTRGKSPAEERVSFLAECVADEQLVVVTGNNDLQLARCLDSNLKCHNELYRWVVPTKLISFLFSESCSFVAFGENENFRELKKT
jgi:hypothetical protein